jgi:hypothetical protein
MSSFLWSGRPEGKGEVLPGARLTLLLMDRQKHFDELFMSLHLKAGLLYCRGLELLFKPTLELSQFAMSGAARSGGHKA